MTPEYHSDKSRNFIHKIEEILIFISESKSKLRSISSSKLQSDKNMLQKYLNSTGDFFQQIQDIINKEFKSHVFSRFRILSKDEIQKLGLKFIKEKKIYKVKKEIFPIFTFPLKNWYLLKEPLFKSSKMQIVLNELFQFYDTSINQKINFILQNVPITVDPFLREKFKIAYKKHPLSFEEFMQTIRNSDLSSKQTGKMDDSQELRKKYQKALERKEILEKKKEQLKSFDNYEQFFALSDRELKRAKRKGTMRRKYQKKTRRDKN
ncbi:hypothetical protein [Candidatus Harpocratesius sp.]